MKIMKKKIKFEACKKMDEEQSIRELTEKLELDKYSNGELLVECILHKVKQEEKRFKYRNE